MHHVAKIGSDPCCCQACLAWRERMHVQFDEIARRQVRCVVCYRPLSGKDIYWRDDGHGQPTWPMCADAKGCGRYHRFILDHVGNGLPNIVDWDAIGVN